uniref:Pancreatic trypsin inhibitor n=1 Tax=Sus scrofa TaxID=9823 RepID=A0A8D1U195_PIG
MCGSWSVRLGQGSQSSEAGASEQEFLVLVSPARPVPPEMGFSGLLLILVPLIVLGGVQEPGLVEAFIVKKCPSNRARCEMKERDQCTKHRQCPNKMNCCKFACGKKCLNIKQDVCSLPKKTGPCLAYLPRWWYDKEKKVCSRFIYGGCQGNNNNFQSENVCKDICSQKSKFQGPQSPLLIWTTLGIDGQVHSRSLAGLGLTEPVQLGGTHAPHGGVSRGRFGEAGEGSSGQRDVGDHAWGCRESKQK